MDKTTDYTCLCCKKSYPEDEMVTYTYYSRTGFCRSCIYQLSYEEITEIERTGINPGMQICMFIAEKKEGEKNPSPLPY